MLRKNVFILFLGWISIGSTYAQELQATHPNAKGSSLRLEILPIKHLDVGKNTVLKFRIINLNDQKALKLNELKEVHTKKLHLLVIDSSLSDYQHIHPTKSNYKDEFEFNFTPKLNNMYRIWADVTPLATNHQEYVMTEVGIQPKKQAHIDKTLKTVTVLEGYTFTLKLDDALAGQAVMGQITVSKDNKPFTQLEPVMGAFAHIVAFSEDYNSVLHIHPMGKEPTKESDRGGPVLEFHLEPQTAGFVKLFAQVRINGKDLFVPFGLFVK